MRIYSTLSWDRWVPLLWFVAGDKLIRFCLYNMMKRVTRGDLLKLHILLSVAKIKLSVSISQPKIVTKHFRIDLLTFIHHD